MFAVIFTYIFGDQSPFTYTFSAIFTILACTKLNLQVGTTVAVLTSVAMIPGIHEAYLLIFLKTLNALIGLVTRISKFFVLPPKYYHQIEENLIHSETKLYELFASRCYELLLGKFDSDNSNTSLSTLSDMNKNRYFNELSTR